MVQYLLNASAIWLISLIMFDVFLKKESYHSYNRFYLLFTFLLGALLPLWQWQDDSVIYTSLASNPVKQMAAIKQNITDAGISSGNINWGTWLTIIYLAGVFVMTLLLIIEILKLIILYKKGIKRTEGALVIIETNKEQAPFSIFNIVFVGSKKNYNEQEWATIIEHEKRHWSLFHILDVFVMQVARILFWFHPLVYMYNKRLLLLHEYQADNIPGAQVAEYGKFLVEQALLGQAPMLTHSFNRSPIKNRIIMLTKRSSTIAKGKLLIFIPLLAVCLLCFTQSSFSYKFNRKGNIITYKGNTFEMAGASANDTMLITDPITGKQEMTIARKDPYPMKMNEEKIYGDNDHVTSKPEMENDKHLSDYILEPARKELSALPDGQYTLDLSAIVVDKEGNIVFYEYGGIHKGLTVAGEKISNQLKEELNAVSKKIEKNINELPAIKPATLNGQPVVYYWPEAGYISFGVNNHLLSY